MQEPAGSKATVNSWYETQEAGAMDVMQPTFVVFVPGLIVATRTESVGSVNFQGCELRGWIQQHVEGEYGAVRVQAQATLRALASLVPRQAAPRHRPAQLHNTSVRTHTLPRNAGLPQLSKMPFKHAGARACARERLRVRT